MKNSLYKINEKVQAYSYNVSFAATIIKIEDIGNRYQYLVVSANNKLWCEESYKGKDFNYIIKSLKCKVCLYK